MKPPKDNFGDDMVVLLSKDGTMTMDFIANYYNLRFCPEGQVFFFSMCKCVLNTRFSY